MASIFDVPARVWTLARKVEDLFENQAKTKLALEAIDERLRALETKTIRLEAERDQLIAEARGAASAAATGVASASVERIVTRLTRLEMQHEGMAGRLTSQGPMPALSKADGGA